MVPYEGNFSMKLYLNIESVMTFTREIIIFSLVSIYGRFLSIYENAIVID